MRNVHIILHYTQSSNTSFYAERALIPIFVNVNALLVSFHNDSIAVILLQEEIIGLFEIIKPGLNQHNGLHYFIYFIDFEYGYIIINKKLLIRSSVSSFKPILMCIWIIF